MFSVGIKDLYQDTKTFVKVKSLIRNAKKNGGGIHSVGLKEIDIFYRSKTNQICFISFYFDILFQCLEKC